MVENDLETIGEGSEHSGICYWNIVWMKSYI